MKLTNKELEALRKMRTKEKQQKIVDAVNALKGELTYDNCYFCEGDTHLCITNSGTLSTAHMNPSPSRCTIICTVEEFNQCVKEMSEARWMNPSGDFYCYESYKEDYQQPEQIEWKNGDKCLWADMESVFVGDVDFGIGLNECVIQIKSQGRLQTAYKSDLKKPKEKRWLVYDAEGNFFKEYDYKPQPEIKSLQVIEIEINV